MASLTIGPTGRIPQQALNEFQYGYIFQAQTAVLVAAGQGTLHTVVVGVNGTLAKFYDTPSGGTTDATTQIATLDLSAAATLPTFILDVAFSKGLTVVVTGSNAELTVSFRGTATTNPKTAGVGV